MTHKFEPIGTRLPLQVLQHRPSLHEWRNEKRVARRRVVKDTKEGEDGRMRQRAPGQRFLHKVLEGHQYRTSESRTALTSR